MLTKSKKPYEVPYSEVTPKWLYMNRRKFMTGAVMAGIAAVGYKSFELFSPDQSVQAGAKLQYTQSKYSTNEKETPYKDVSTYNNFYEFSTDKDGPSQLSGKFQTRPWEVSIEGEVEKHKKIDIDALMKLAPLEERIYRHRCVEGWSIVVPWIGFPMKALIDYAQPTSKAKFVQFETVFRPSEMPGQNRDVLQWPYVEGLRLDEAQNVLSMITVGMYGETLPNQNGAPVRITIPWKYGFKSIKSIVKVKFVKNQPNTTWNLDAPNEYGFYSNVNPNVDHPRWSQAKERRLGEFFKRPTLMFNGYGDQVASMYNGMDLKKNF
ncbi:MAG TPA: protein-methionine-sulfoxide reductase catalytic subunit MsrP [Terriglobales bacterium]|nr:protein-methionine-sulfoxide reductase catalytic subunit MsrP [Terriglobales bacterium]